MRVTRSDYVDIGLQALAESGSVGLKLAEVCHRLKVQSNDAADIHSVDPEGLTPVTTTKGAI